MLLLQIPLLTVLLAAGDNEDAFQEEISFKIILSSSFYNRSWVKSQNSAWLGDLQTHGWDSNSGRIIFLRPWSKGNFSKEEMKELEKFFYLLLIDVPLTIQRHASQWKFTYPFETQITGGCELHPGGAIVDFSQLAYQGSELLHFQNNSWLPSVKDEITAEPMSRVFSQYHVSNKIIRRLLSDTCPRFLLSILDAGKADLQREVKPEAWLSTGPNPGPDRQMLVCHVSGFHPKPIWVKWMRGEQVQQSTQQSGILPNADGTWYLEVFLEVEATETSGLYCRVRHSSLGGQDILLYLAFQEQIFKMIYSSSFYNRSWVKSRHSAWLGDLQTHVWDSNSQTLIFLRPWSKGNLSKKEIKELVEFHRLFSAQMPNQLHRHARQWQLKYPFEIQITGGCELHPEKGMVIFLKVAYQGSELMHFHNNSWLPSVKDEITAQPMIRRVNQYHITNRIVQRLLSHSCPPFLLSILDAGKEDLQRKVKPEAWLSTGPNPGPDRQMLVCHVSGFHPKPIWVKWMRGEQVQQSTQQSGILPNADGTWYLEVFLEVEATETSGLYCRVRHSSLGGQDILLYLEHHHSSKDWIILAVMVPLVLLTALAFWLRKSWSHCELPVRLLPLK
ncbi:unnamed protein product [Pipistrellus nathusii]|uniref:Ig-like domain-containing protein n=1 Tax=Pipistrellus nathusii TaxID=59473 RepID=A0ABP0ACD7_PIPNA